MLAYTGVIYAKYEISRGYFVKDTIDENLMKYINDVLNVCSNRAAFVINHILEHGQITSEDLKKAGYIHGARAVGDVRDNGLPLITSRTKTLDNRTIAVYTFGDVRDINIKKYGGRINFPKTLKAQLISKYGNNCCISKIKLTESELQIDHRIPFYIAGEHNDFNDLESFMLLSRSMQRAKSWDCENCHNKNPEICKTCYWAYPDNYLHVALNQIRDLRIVWNFNEINSYEALKKAAIGQSLSIQDYVKNIIKHKLGI